MDNELNCQVHKLFYMNNSHSSFFLCEEKVKSHHIHRTVCTYLTITTVRKVYWVVLLGFSISVFRFIHTQQQKQNPLSDFFQFLPYAMLLVFSVHNMFVLNRILFSCAAMVLRILRVPFNFVFNFLFLFSLSISISVLLSLSFPHFLFIPRLFSECCGAHLSYFTHFYRKFLGKSVDQTYIIVEEQWFYFNSS